uniref:Xaa-Pro aminopeptidase 1 n=1 Tax=Cacopsylla melanoneura TaxID=428564 RepID=A0A8D8VMY0_9HEMI
MGTAKNTTAILQKLRSIMQTKSNHLAEAIQAYIVTSTDAHTSEYLAEADKRRAFVSGFTGSAGTAVVTLDKALLWTDGRYYLQASQELDSNWTLMKSGLPTTLTEKEWLAKNLPSGSRVGVDPNLITLQEYKAYETEFEHANLTIVPIKTNLVDLVWDNKPSCPNAAITPLGLKYSGKTIEKKVEEVRQKMKEKNAVILVLTALDEIAYLLNLRGSDIEFNPVFFSYVIVTDSSIQLFIEESRVSDTIRNHFNQENCPITIQSYDNVHSFLTELVANLKPGKKAWISEYSNYALASVIPRKHLVSDITPVNVMKAVKNPVEIQGMVNSHIRDAAALITYLAWLEKEILSGHHVTEISGATKLEEFRSQQEDFVGLSFDTISSAGSNGAIIHYKPQPETDRPITAQEMYLVDSGGQYKDGTTDVTRTVHFGTPSEFEKECFTRVFKGCAALAMTVFPEKLKGHAIDAIARHTLWSVGLDYAHGTGHGIGSYLNVHEGPMSISFNPRPADPGLLSGMFLSDEPGYYEDGKFGVRIENIVQVIPVETKYSRKNKPFLGFKTITLVPIQTSLLNISLLSCEEIKFLNDFHQECRDVVGPVLKQKGQNEAFEWLVKQTEPIHD